MPLRIRNEIPAGMRNPIDLMEGVRKISNAWHAHPSSLKHLFSLYRAATGSKERPDRGV